MAKKQRFTKQVGVLFEPETYDYLVKLTDENEITLSEFIRNTVLVYLEKLNKGECSHDYSN